MSFQPPVTLTPMHGFDPPRAASYSPTASQFFAAPSATQYAIVTRDGIGRNAIATRTWAEAERLGLVATTYGSRLSMAVSASRRY